MHFSIQLSAYYPDKSYGGDRVYRDMLEQARCADKCGYESVGITEHHLINILMMPAPLQFAVKIASQTKNVKIITAVSVLPLHDMRILAGELVCADIFTDQRLIGDHRGTISAIDAVAEENSRVAGCDDNVAACFGDSERCVFA